MQKHKLLMATAILLATAGAAYGQAQPGDLGVFFTATPTTGADIVEHDVVVFAPVADIFVVSFDVPGGMEAYEFSLQLPVGLLVTGGRILPAGATDYGAGDDNWIVGLGGACVGASGTFVLVRYAEPLFLAPPGNDLPICLGPAFPNNLVHSPDYLVCDAPGDIRIFGAAYPGCAVINPTNLPEPLPALDRSFGALKAAY